MECPICNKTVKTQFGNARRHLTACMKDNNGFVSLQQAGEWLVAHGFLSHNLVDWKHYGTGRTVELVHCQRGYVRLVSD